MLSTLGLFSAVSAAAGDFPENNTIYIETSEGIGSIYSYQQGKEKFYLATEPDGSTTIIVLNTETGAISVDGEIISYQLDAVAIPSMFANAKDNWGPERTTDYTIPLDGMSEIAITAVLMAYGVHDIPAGMVAALVSQQIPVLYYRVKLRYNYVDYSPKVGIRQTDQFFWHGGFTAVPDAERTVTYVK